MVYKTYSEPNPQESLVFPVDYFLPFMHQGFIDWLSIFESRNSITTQSLSARRLLQLLLLHEKDLLTQFFFGFLPALNLQLLHDRKITMTGRRKVT